MADLLRLATAGSVDDGKSTLIGRLLVDAKQVMADQVDAVRAATERKGGSGLDLALLTDGLRAEREQGITIDVAYRYFATPKRRFILADTPGHAEYTRNMLTGASTADLSVVLVDVRHGVVSQTRRHLAIAHLLQVPEVVVCVNKMDLAGYREAAFDRVVRDVCEVAAGLGMHRVTYIPISALHGDNVVDRSEAMPWYAGPPLLEHLETTDAADAGAAADGPARLPVQWVLDGDGASHPAGQLAGGRLEAGDEIVILPAGTRARVAAVEAWDGPLEVAVAPQSVSVRLEDGAQAQRGDLLAAAGTAPEPRTEHRATVCWMAEAPLRPGARLLLKHTTRTTQVVVEALEDRLDVATLGREPAPEALELNDIAAVRLRTEVPLAADPYAENRTTGSFILIDGETNETVAAGLL